MQRASIDALVTGRQNLTDEVVTQLRESIEKLSESDGGQLEGLPEDGRRALLWAYEDLRRNLEVGCPC